MSESFGQRMKIFRENLAGMYDNGHMTKWADADTSVDLDSLQRAHDHEIKMVSKSRYHDGYEDGRRSMDTEHAAVALRLRRLPLDVDTTENLSQIARAVWHSDFGWAQCACRALRDELVRLLGGVSEQPYPTSTYDVLGNERHKAVCRLRYIRDCLKGDSTCNSLNIADAIGAKLDVGDHLHESICDRLIYLLGGNEKYFHVSVREDGSIDRRADQSHESSPMSLENETGITDELRECVEKATKTYDDTLWHEMGDDSDADHTICHITEGELLGIAERIEEQFARVCELWERTATDTAQSVHDSMEAECNKLQAECNRLTSALDELHADPANDVICRLERERDQLRANLEEADAAIANYRERKKSFAESELLRDKLQKRLDEMREQREHWADEAIKMYRLFFSHDEYCVPNSPSEMVSVAVRTLQEKCSDAESECRELKAKTDAIREVLDGDH